MEQTLKEILQELKIIRGHFTNSSEKEFILGELEKYENYKINDKKEKLIAYYEFKKGRVAKRVKYGVTNIYEVETGFGQTMEEAQKDLIAKENS